MNVLISGFIGLSSVLMLQLLTPYWMVAVLLFQTLMVGLFLGLSKGSLWFAYILFLVFLGGMLVIFSYMSSLVPEELMESIPYQTALGGSTMIFISVSLLYFLSVSSVFPSESVLSGKKVINVMNELFSFSKMFMYCFVVSYLLLALFCVANMAKSKFGPLRLSS
nr:NADH dehydrogenase subunit 6 [Isocladus armatus]